MTEGEIVVRGAEEPLAVEQPTTVAGTIETDTGSLTEVAFDTPPVTFVREITDPVPTTATITATFSQIGTGEGTLNAEGSMTVELRLAVDLHIVVAILPEPQDCRAQPIDLTLVSTVPYDGETVTIGAPDFSIPPATITPTCQGIVADKVNEELSGSGHSVSFTLEGDLTRPPAGRFPTETSVVASPSGAAALGAPVTLTATATSAAAEADPGVDPPLNGTIEFRDGRTVVGTAPAVSGVAELVTPALPAGIRQITAIYLGLQPDYQQTLPSNAEVLPYTVIAPPGVTVDTPEMVEAGGLAAPLTVTVTNTGFGSALNDAELRVRIERPSGFGPIGPDGATPRVVLRRTPEGGTPAEVTLAFDGLALSGVIGDPGDWAVPPGQDLTELLELEVSAATEPGPLRLTFTLVGDPGGTPTDLASGSGDIPILPGERVATSLSAGDPGFPPFFPAIPPVTPIVARQGNVVEIYGLRVDSSVSTVPSGSFRFSIDGRPVTAMIPDPTGDAQWRTSIPLTQATTSILLLLPPDIRTGALNVEARYSGDSVFRPSQATFPATVAPSAGPVYDCQAQGLLRWRFTANVDVDALVPSRWPAGSTFDLSAMSIRLLSARTISHEGVSFDLVDPMLDPTLEADLGDDGNVSFATATRTANTPMYEDDGLGFDSVLELSDATGSVVVDETPGTAQELTLDTISATVVNSAGFLSGIVCTPTNEPVSLGTVTAAGTALTVEPDTVVALGDPVTLTASVFPVASGVVEFRDGTTTVGVATVNASGVATITTTNLPRGLRSLNARFLGGAGASSPSSAEPLTVVATCSDALDPGNGAAVRLVYIEFLRRCPDPAGYRFWRARLDDGLSTREQFAAQISQSLEAREVIVDDAYRTMLERPAEAAGRRYWAIRLGANAGYDDLLADLAVSREFTQLSGGTDEGFVTRVYEQILGRSPEASGLEFWVAYLDRYGRRRLVQRMFDLAEPKAAIVTGTYLDLLGRAPTAEELAVGSALFNTEKNRSKVAAAVIGSTAFFDRAQEFPELA